MYVPSLTRACALIKTKSLAKTSTGISFFACASRLQQLIYQSTFEVLLHLKTNCVGTLKLGARILRR